MELVAGVLSLESRFKSFEDTVMSEEADRSVIGVHLALRGRSYRTRHLTEEDSSTRRAKSA